MSQEILLVNANGSDIAVSSQFPDHGLHYDKVDDLAVNDSDYIYTNSTSYQRDLFAIQDSGFGGGIIDSVVVTIRARCSTGKAYCAVRTGGVTHDGTTEHALTPTFTDQTETWTTNPETGSAWTWDEVNALGAGVKLKRPLGGGFDTGRVILLAQAHDAQAGTIGLLGIGAGAQHPLHHFRGGRSCIARPLDKA